MKELVGGWRRRRGGSAGGPPPMVVGSRTGGRGGVVRKNPGNEPQGQEEEVERESQGCLLVLLGV